MKCNNNNCKKRKPTSFSLSIDTLEKLEEYAKEHHTNKTQAITNLIWEADANSWMAMMQHKPSDEDDLDYIPDEGFIGGLGDEA